MKRFALIGAAGYIAPRHMKAIRDTGNSLVAAMDKNDSVGIIDSYFPEASFFTEFERFDRHLEKLKRKGEKIDYLVVCSPNYLHDAHIRFGLRYGADVICEKPTVLNPWNIKGLQKIEEETKRKVFNVLQLRLHPNVIKLKESIEKSNAEFYECELSYIVSRGLWYYASWKGDVQKSGGIATNIGVHFFDMLSWIFGDLEDQKIHIHSHDRAAGVITFKNAQVKWFLSINKDLLPEDIETSSLRSLTINGEQVDFTSGFEELHTKSYQKIYSGDGFTLSDTESAIKIVHDIRSMGIEENTEEAHYLCKQPLTPHPFLKK